MRLHDPKVRRWLQAIATVAGATALLAFVGFAVLDIRHRTREEAAQAEATRARRCTRLLGLARASSDSLQVFLRYPDCAEAP